MQIRIEDLIITVAYFSIPLQILVSLHHYPRLNAMPLRIVVLLILFALFIFLCGAGHMLKCLNMTGTYLFHIMNWCTAFISMATALFLLPMVPNLMNSIDEGLENIRMNEQIMSEKQKLMTFMAFLCHEIRNPLFAITSTISFMHDDESLSPDQERALSSISQSTNLMLRIVNDVLDISKLESGKLELESRLFHLREIFGNVASSAETQILEKHDGAVRFEFNMTPEVPEVVLGDSARILQILYNLLSNAAKFTEEGKIELNVDACDYKWAEKKGLVHDASDPNKKSNRRGHGDDDDEDDDDDDDDDSGNFAMSLLDAESGKRTAAMLDTSSAAIKIEVKDTGAGIAKDRLSRIFEPYSQSKLSDYRKHGGTGLGLSILKHICRNMGGTISVSSEVGKGSTFTVYLPMKVPNKTASVPLVETETILKEGLGQARLGKRQESAGSQATVSSSSSCPDLFDAAPVDYFEELKDVNPPKQLQLEDIPKRLDSPPSPPPPKQSSLPKFNLPSNETVVLVVDDNAVNRKMISKMLDHFNIEHKLAKNGQDAVDAIAASRNVTGDPSAPKFGLVLMDMSMPIMGGIEATRIIRQRKLSIPIIALTANALNVHKHEALQAGATAFMTKPILRDQLHGVCSEFLTPHQ